MHDHGKSDRPVLPAKLPNKPGVPGAEAVEGRGLPEGNTASETRPGRSAGLGVSSDLDRVRQVARKDRDVRFTALLHHVTVDRLREAYRAISPNAAAGVDGVTWRDYGLDLEANLRDLHARVHRGAYRARPSRRVFIPKPDGRLRPLGVAAWRTRSSSGRWSRCLNAVYEEDFLGFSYGFRPGRSQHDALDALAAGITRKKVSFVLDADISDFFTGLDQSWLVKFLEHRIADKTGPAADPEMAGRRGHRGRGMVKARRRERRKGHRYLRCSRTSSFITCLTCGPTSGGGGNARGDVILVRYADDYVAGFERREDAERFLADLRERFAEFGLELHPEKTRLIEFGRFAAERRQARGLRKPETFEFLGLTHICAKGRNGRFKVKRVTSKKKMRAKLHAVKAEMRRRMHHPIPEQGRWLASVLQGHYNYYAVPDNIEALRGFRERVIRHWRHALSRRSQKGRLTWERTRCLADRWLPQPRILHPWPNVRFDARTQGRSPVR